MTLNQAFDRFIINRRLKGSTEKTLHNYADFNRRFLNYVGNIDVEQLTIDDVNEYLLSLHEKDISLSTVATYSRHIKAFLHWLAEEYKLDFPYKKIVIAKQPKKDIYLYNAKEIKLIFDAIDAYPEWIKKRNYCIVSLMLDSGLRQSEVAHIRLCNVDFIEKTILVLGKGNKERKVPLGSFTERNIHEFLDICPYSNDYLFCDKVGNELTANTIKKMISKIQKKLPFEFSSHKLRHNFATNYCIDQYEEKGIMDPYSLMILLGHEDMETSNRYIHIAQEVISCRKNISHLDKIFLS